MSTCAKLFTPDEVAYHGGIGPSLRIRYYILHNNTSVCVFNNHSRLVYSYLKIGRPVLGVTATGSSSDLFSSASSFTSAT